MRVWSLENWDYLGLKTAQKTHKTRGQHHESAQKSAQHTSIGTMGNAPMRVLIALMRALIVPSNCVLLQLALRSMHVVLIFAHI